MALYPLVRPLVFALDAERAHRLTIRALRAMPPGLPAKHDRRLAIRLAGLDFPNPVGLAAGFDKDAEVHRQMLGFGFGFVEVGTLTPLAQQGNPKPRLFRLAEDGAVINRMGFNNGGFAAAKPRLAARRRGGIVGINVGANKESPDRIADYVAGVREMAPLADYLAVNVSSPNTPGLRDLQAVASLRPILQAVQAEAGGRPVLVKIAPDLSDEDVDAVADLAIELGLEGIIATNTTVSRAGLKTPEDEVEVAGAGGISGPPVRARALEVLRRLRARTDGRLTLVAAGGIGDVADAWERMEAGADLVELYTGFIYGGPLTATRLNRGLARRLRARETVHHRSGNRKSP